MLGGGLSQQEMSDKLHRSLATVWTHIQHIKQTLGADSDKHAVGVAIVDGALSYSKKFAI